MKSKCPEYLQLFLDQGSLKIEVRFVNSNASITSFKVQKDEIGNLFSEETGKFLGELAFDGHPFKVVKYELVPNSNTILIFAVKKTSSSKAKRKRIRGTALVIRNNKILLVQDFGKKAFSLPGGGTKNNEPSLSAAIRELYEELAMSASKANRVFECDYSGAFTNHKVSKIETEDRPILLGSELEKFIWWDGQSDISRFPHVDAIISKLQL